MPGQDGKTADIVLTAGDDGREVEADVGDIVRLDLEFAGGTGYAWHVEAVDETVLRPAGMKTEPLTGRQTTGGTMKGSWYFEAASPGKVRLRLLYYRAWEGVQNAINSFEAVIVIRAKP